MRTFYTLVKKDLRGYFDQPTGYILMVIFLAVVAFFFFRTLETSRNVSLRPLFDIITLPWILPVFVAASTMRLMAEEQRDGTLEILLTQPIRGWSVLLAKFFAGWLFVSMGIVFTVGIPLALSTAGDLDDGATTALYIGTFFLSASFVAIGLFASSLTRNQIVAFMTSLAVMVALMFAGSPLVTLALPGELAVLVQDLSPSTHYTAISRGLLDVRDILYFLALVSVFLSGAYLMLRGKSISHRSPLFRNLQLGVAGLVVVSLLVGWFGGKIDGQLDLTEKKLHTFSDATVSLLTGLDDLLTVKYFFSDSGDLPPRAAIVQRELEDFLDNIADQSNGNIRILRRPTDPEDDDAVREARENLIRPIQHNVQTQGELSIKVGYLGLSMTHINLREIIPSISSTDGLEFVFASAVFRMVQRDPKIVGFLANSEDTQSTFQEGGEPDFRSFRTALADQVQVDEVRETRTGLIQLGGIDALVITGPMRQIPTTMLEEIDTYLAGGGQALFLLDPVQVDTQDLRGEVNGFGLADYVAGYGVEVNDDLIFDVRSFESLTVPDVFAPILIPYPYWVRIPETDARVSGSVTSVVFPWASSVGATQPTAATVEIEEVIPLVETTQFGAVDAEFQNLFPQSPHLVDVADEDLGKRTLALAITGTRCRPDDLDCTKDPTKRFRIIVAGDSNWINEGWVGQSPGHMEMAINWIDWLTQDDALAAIRAKGKTIRTLLYSSETHRQLVRYSNMAGVPALFVVLGLIRFLMRRNLTRKVYTREE